MLLSGHVINLIDTEEQEKQPKTFPATAFVFTTDDIALCLLRTTYEPMTAVIQRYLSLHEVKRHT